MRCQTPNFPLHVSLNATFHTAVIPMMHSLSVVNIGITDNGWFLGHFGLSMVLVSDLNQHRHQAALVNLQDLSIFGSQQDMTMAQCDGSDGRVILQKQT